jgi:hypothetical protein
MAQFAGVNCLSTVYPIGEGWVGKSTSGEVRFFQNLSDYQQFLSNLAQSGKVCPDVSVPVAKPREETTRTYPTGFLEFLPRNSAEQAKYSAMSPGWLGQEATQKAVEQGKFAEEEVYFYKAKDVRGGQVQSSPGDDFRLQDRKFAIG